MDSLATSDRFKRGWVGWRQNYSPWEVGIGSPNNASPALLLNSIIYDGRPDHAEARNIALMYSGMWKMLMRSMAKSKKETSWRQWAPFWNIRRSRSIEDEDALDNIKQRMEHNIIQLLQLENILPPPSLEATSATVPPIDLESTHEEPQLPMSPVDGLDQGDFQQEDSQTED